MKRAVVGIAAVTAALMSLVDGARANTIVRWPYKSSPYAVPHPHVSKQAAIAIALKHGRRHASHKHESRYLR